MNNVWCIKLGHFGYFDKWMNCMNLSWKIQQQHRVILYIGILLAICPSEAAALGVQMALGMPFYMLPFGCAGAYFCVQFYYKRKLWDYVCFCATLAMVICW